MEEYETAINNLEDVKDYADSPMVISGGEISKGSDQETYPGSFKVAALTALLRKTNSSTGELVKVSLDEQDNQTITAADTTYIVCLNYNDGSPTISLSETNPYDSDKRNIPIGEVAKDSSDNVHFISGGFNFQDGVEKLHMRARTLRELELNDGSAIAYSGTNNFTMEEGIAYGGINKFPLSSYDSSITQFTGLRGDGAGGWTETLSNVIDFAHYDDGAGGLGNIGNNKYGCHWVYKHIDDDDVYVRLGVGSYTLAEAMLAQEPTKPAHLTDFGVLIGKIIAPQSGSSFTAVQMVTERFFTGTAVSDHGNLTGLSDDDHTQYALLAGRAGGQTLIGGTASGEDLTLQSSSDATKGNIYLGAAQTSYFDEDNENLKINGAITIGSADTEAPLNFILPGAGDQTVIKFQNTETTADAAISFDGSSVGSDLLFGSNLYFLGSSITRYNTSKASSAIWLKETGEFSIYTGDTEAIATQRLAISSAGAFDFKSNNVSGMGTLGCGAITSSGNFQTNGGYIYINRNGDAVNAQFYIASDNDKICEINFGDPQDGDIGRIWYDHSDNSMKLYTSATLALTIDSSQNATFAGDIECGAITATSYDGVLAANLLDKTVNEVITGIWSFKGDDWNPITIQRSKDSIGAAYFVGYKSRGSVGSETAIVSGDVLGGFQFRGYDGTGFDESARIDVVSEGTIATGQIPTKWVFKTSNSSGTLTDESSARAYLSTDQTIPTGTYTTLALDTEEWDTQSEFDTSTHTFTAKKAGYYLVIVRIKWSTNTTTSWRRLRVITPDNTNEYIYTEAGTQPTGHWSQGVSGIVYLGANHRVYAQVYQASGEDLSIFGDKTMSFMAIHKLN